MTDKRLKEIKDSIDLQLEIAKQLNVDNELLLEEKELYEYAEELKKQLEEANKKLYLCTPEIPQNVHGEYVSYVDLVNEIYELKEQLDYLRTGEYYNQLRFERDMLQDVVDNGEVSKEDREFIDCTHRNTELLEQQQEFIKYLENIIEELECDDVDDEEMRGYLFQRIDTFKEILTKYKEIIGVSDQ